ncbi:solute carrier organic anion transporter family member 4C1-like [Diadema antillarum]|uniref:solute carrier organic anion transporter family member 4C1-like n=1 Tax=Diadema antillarum TaxID=105358 RepID=UPI003A886F57
MATQSQNPAAQTTPFFTVKDPAGQGVPSAKQSTEVIQFVNGETGASGNADKVAATKSPAKSNELDDECEIEEFRCGWCGWRPQWLQNFNSAPWLLVTLTAAVGIEAMLVTGFVTSTLTSIERRFQLRSRDLGIIISSFDVTSIILVLFVTFVGGRGNKPRWLGTGCIIIGAGALIYALPHFTTGNYRYVTSLVSATCGASGAANCSELLKEEETPSSLSKYMYMFMAGQTLMAIGSLPLNTLGVSMLDESVSLEQTGLYIGIFFAVASLGPAAGYMLMGVFLNTFTDFAAPFSKDISPADPGWVGAWWIGFVMAAVPAFVFGIPLSLFPMELPDTARIRKSKESQVHARGGAHETERPGFGSRPTDFIVSLKYLANNPTVMCTIFGICADTMLVAGFAAFMPKFTQNQFKQTASSANFIIGIAMLPGLSGGVLLGGLLMKRFNLKVRGMLSFSIVSGLIMIVLFGTVLLRCPQQPVIGVTAGYDGQNLMEYNSDKSLDVECNSGCDCNTEQYNPVCLDGGIAQYFDPCFAGCKTDYGNGTYGECVCLLNFVSANLTWPTQVQHGACASDCILLPIFVVGSALLLFFHFLPSVALVNTLLRCVPESQRPMALGVNSILNKLLGATPGPILVGVMMDGACLQWQNTCDSEGACWIYNNENLSWRMFGLGLIMKVASVSLFSLALCFYRPVNDPPSSDSGAQAAAGAATNTNTSGTTDQANEAVATAACGGESFDVEGAVALTKQQASPCRPSRDLALGPEEIVPLDARNVSYHDAR